jgi:hypothetical protein
MRHRLAVPMLLFAAVGLGLHAPPLRGEDSLGWEYLENRDPHSKGVVAMARFHDPSGAFAMVRCWSATGVLDVRLGFPGVERQAPRAVGLGFDDGRPISARVLLSPNRRALIVAPEDRARVLDGLRRAHLLRIGAGNDNEADAPVTMRLTGSSRTIAQVEAHCLR